MGKNEAPRGLGYIPGLFQPYLLSVLATNSHPDSASELRYSNVRFSHAYSLSFVAYGANDAP